MNNLFIALMKKGIKPEQAAKVISQLLGCSERTARNKLKEVTDFSVTEAIKINEKIFDNPRSNNTCAVCDSRNMGRLL